MHLLNVRLNRIVVVASPTSLAEKRGMDNWYLYLTLP